MDCHFLWFHLMIYMGFPFLGGVFCFVFFVGFVVVWVLEGLGWCGARRPHSNLTHPCFLFCFVFRGEGVFFVWFAFGRFRVMLGPLGPHSKPNPSLFAVRFWLCFGLVFCWFLLCCREQHQHRTNIQEHPPFFIVFLAWFHDMDLPKERPRTTKTKTKNFPNNPS